jgi:hypothetical protein
MRSFFLTIILISSAVTLIILYYTVKHILNLKNENRRKSLIDKKLYEDDRSYLQSKLRNLIKDLKSGQLHWFIISSKIEIESKLEITYSTIREEIQIKDRGRFRTNSELTRLSEIGISQYETSNEINIISVPLNAKIITDVVYFIFEDIFCLKSVKNLKILISGE